MGRDLESLRAEVALESHQPVAANRQT
jgi:hypothetical protein